MLNRQFATLRLLIAALAFASSLGLGLPQTGGATAASDVVSGNSGAADDVTGWNIPGAIVTSVTLTPTTITGSETGTFDVSFSQPMNQAQAPELSFASTQRHVWVDHDLAGWNLADLAVDLDNTVWAATPNGALHFDGEVWHNYTTANSGLSNNTLASVEIDAAGVKWFVGHHHLMSFDGATWTTIDLEPLGLYNPGPLAIAPDGSKWIGTNGFGVAHLQGGVWTFYDPIPPNGEAVLYTRIYVEPDGTAWALTNNHGLASIQGGTTTHYHPGNSPVTLNTVQELAADPEGAMWFVITGGLQRLAGGAWDSYDLAGSALQGQSVSSVAFDAQGDLWLAAESCAAGPCVKGVAHLSGGQWSFNPHACGLLRLDGQQRAWCLEDNQTAVTGNDRVYAVDGDGHWVDADTYRASYDFNALVPSGTYSLTIAGAVDLDDQVLTPDSAFTFTVAYGEFDHLGALAAPSIFASGDADDATALLASWSNHDTGSTVESYRYAIGAIPGSADVVAWTSTAAVLTNRTGLGLQPGHTYWVSVQARNEAGGWSFVARDWFIAGQTKLVRVYLPLLAK